MTTVAYRDGVMAADSRGTLSGWVLPGRETKLLRLKDGRVAAITGDSAQGEALLLWIRGDRSSPQPRGECCVIVAGRRLQIFENGHHYLEPAKFMAWGSGMPVALGALHAGATASEAVRIAGLVDPATGGKIVSMKVEQK